MRAEPLECFFGRWRSTVKNVSHAPPPPLPDETEHQVFGNCVGGGVNLFDTAEVYGLGRSEYLCGKFRRDYKGADKSGIVVGERSEGRLIASSGFALLPVP